jgi:hypothetical protein
VPGIAGCEVAAGSVVCEGNWPQAPETPCAQCPQVMHMDQAVVDTNGNLTWRDANIGNPDAGGPGWVVVKVGQPRGSAARNPLIRRDADHHRTGSSTSPPNNMSVRSVNSSTPTASRIAGNREAS